jgi:hypothetical protein
MVIKNVTADCMAIKNSHGGEPAFFSKVRFNKEAPARGIRPEQCATLKKGIGTRSLGSNPFRPLFLSRFLDYAPA